MNANRYFRLVSSQSITPPMERCLACEADEGSPPPDPSKLLGTLARQALMAEAELTPKPGLVDRRGSGAHSDLSLSLMIRSAFAIEPFIHLMAFQSMNEPPSSRLRATLAATGRAAERAMRQVTNGSNTHKGAIWTLGLLAAAAAIGRDELPTTPSLCSDRGPLIRGRDVVSQFNSHPYSIARTASLIASFADSYEPTPNTKRRFVRHSFSDVGTLNESISHGQIVAQKFGVTGARGEAINGFPHIIEVGLPMLRARRTANVPEPIARLDSLLSIMASLVDTCLLYRGGKPALQAAQQGAAVVIAAGGAGTSRGREHLLALDNRLLELRVSPGGSADLLAGTLFLDAIERQPTEIWSWRRLSVSTYQSPFTNHISPDLAPEERNIYRYK
ncbi:MAG TPA: triphosphoribosyl-dephospho-CoA synthase [Chthoniobacterales bacterium]|nr:triphosphoribosyl-dephospho-CoA synthase [Chthoniobacterales bacterium]